MLYKVAVRVQKYFLSRYKKSFLVQYRSRYFCRRIFNYCWLFELL